MKLIDADKLSANMYHEAFETDTDMQKWDSGCWIRYKMFENQIEKLPTEEAIPIEWIKKFVNERAANDGPDGWWHCWGEDVLLMIAQWEKEND